MGCSNLLYLRLLPLSIVFYSLQLTLFFLSTLISRPAHSGCGNKWYYSMLGDEPLIYKLKKKSRVEITYTIEVYVEIDSCYNVSVKRQIILSAALYATFSIMCPSKQRSI